MNEELYNVYWGHEEIASSVRLDVAIVIAEGFFSKYSSEAKAGVGITLVMVEEDAHEEG